MRILYKSFLKGMVSTTATVYGLNKNKELNLDFAEIATKFPVRINKSDQPLELGIAYDLRIENEIERVNKMFEKNVSYYSSIFRFITSYSL